MRRLCWILIIASCTEHDVLRPVVVPPPIVQSGRTVAPPLPAPDRDCDVFFEPTRLPPKALTATPDGFALLLGETYGGEHALHLFGKDGVRTSSVVLPIGARTMIAVGDELWLIRGDKQLTVHRLDKNGFGIAVPVIVSEHFQRDLITAVYNPDLHEVVLSGYQGLYRIDASTAETISGPHPLAPSKSLIQLAWNGSGGVYAAMFANESATGLHLLEFPPDVTTVSRSEFVFPNNTWVIETIGDAGSYSGPLYDPETNRYVATVNIRPPLSLPPTASQNLILSFSPGFTNPTIWDWSLTTYWRHHAVVVADGSRLVVAATPVYENGLHASAVDSLVGPVGATHRLDCLHDLNLFLTVSAAHGVLFSAWTGARDQLGTMWRVHPLF